jgi:hypothetical protein
MASGADCSGPRLWGRAPEPGSSFGTKLATWVSSSEVALSPVFRDVSLCGGILEQSVGASRGSY